MVIKQHFEHGSLSKALNLKAVDNIQWSIVLCGNDKIKSLNSQYRHKAKVTDVLSFPVFESLRTGHKEHPLPSQISLGDIYICLPVAKRQSNEFSITLEQEIIHLYTHGLLHLLGFDHERSRIEEKIMQKLESTIVKTIYEKNGFKKKNIKKVETQND